MKSSAKPLIKALLTILVMVFATLHLHAQTGWTPRYSVITPGSNQVTLLWSANPTYRYMLKSTTNLALPFTPTPDISTNLQTQTNYISITVPLTSPARFFELFTYDASGPHIDDMWPAQGAVGIDPQEALTARITSAAPLNLNSLQMTVAGQTVDWPDSRLTFTNSYVTFTPGTNDSLGATGEITSVTLYVADVNGYGTPQTWSFRIARPLALRNSVMFVDTGAGLNLLSQPGPNTFVYSYSGIVSGITNGTCLVNTNYSTTNNQSYARMVLSYSDNPSDQTVTVMTRQADVGEIFSGTLRISAPITSSGGTNQVARRRIPPGVINLGATPQFDIGCIPFGNQSLYSGNLGNLNVNLTTTPNTGICLNGHLDCGLDYVQGCIPDTGICSPSVPDGAHAYLDLTASGELALELDISGSWDSSNTIPIYNAPLGVIPVFGVPITVGLLLNLEYQVSVSGNISVTAGVDFSETANIGYHADLSSGAGPIVNFNLPQLTPVWSDTIDASLYARAGIQAGISVSVADVAWASASVTPYAEAKLNLFCWDPTDNTNQAAASPYYSNPTGEDLSTLIDAGLDGDISIGVLSLSKTFSTQLIPPETILNVVNSLYPCGSGGGPPPPSGYQAGDLFATNQNPYSFLALGLNTNLISEVNGLTKYRWLRKAGATLLPLSDDSHIHNTAGRILYIENPQTSDGGTYVLATVTSNGLAFSESVVNAVFPPPSDPSLDAYASLAWIPPGSFLMGSPTNEPERSEDEPEHEVTITHGFYMGQFEVSQYDFHQVMSTNPSYFMDASNLPVETVTWSDAENYCAQLTRRQLAAGLIPAGWAYRLPTEAEWEYACRTNSDFTGGLSDPKTAFCFGPNLLGQMANFGCTNEYETSIGTIVFEQSPYMMGQTTPVGSYMPSYAGLFDLHGNVAEWCQDWYGPYSSTNGSQDPQGPATGIARVIRGGSWMDSGTDCRAAKRDSASPTSAMPNVGFRVVLSDYAGLPTGPNAPTVITLAASSLTASSALLNGTVNPNGADTTWWFEYGLDTNYTAGDTASELAGASNTNAVPVNFEIAGLNASTVYHCQLVGSNSSGVSYGGDQSFTTAAAAPMPPSVVTRAASSITSSSAQLNGTVNPNGADATCWFEYGLDTNYSGGDTAPKVIDLSNTNAVAVGWLVDGLEASTLYHCQLVASNSAGLSYGGDQSFTTAVQSPPPTLLTLAASSITTTSAVLNGTINGMGSYSVAHFKYGTDTNYSGGQVGTYFTSTTGATEPFTYALGGLMPNTTYHYLAFGFNCCMEGFGSDVTFTTAAVQPPPTVTTLAASSITTNSATINGSINPNGPTATAYFQYSASPFGPFQGGIAASPYYYPSGNYLQDYAYTLTGLTPNTTYYFLFEAYNSSSNNGSLLTFTTAAMPQPPPAVTTLAPSSVTETGATLNGSVNPNGGPTTAYFEWGTSTNYGNITTQTGIGTNEESDFQASLTGLSSSATYHYRIVALNSGGATYGADTTFTTAWVPTPPTLIAPGSSTPGAVTLSTLTPTFSWSASSLASDSTLIITKYPYGSGNIVATVGVATLSSYPLPGGYFQQGTDYSWYMISYNSLGDPSAASSSYYFETAAAPTATTMAASGISFDDAELNASVNPNGLSTTVYFQFGTTTSYGSTTSSTNIGSGTGAVSVGIYTGAIDSGTTYHFRVVAFNSLGTTYGSDLSFTTPTE